MEGLRAWLQREYPVCRNCSHRDVDHTASVCTYLVGPWAKLCHCHRYIEHGTGLFCASCDSTERTRKHLIGCNFGLLRLRMLNGRSSGELEKLWHSALRAVGIKDDGTFAGLVKAKDEKLDMLRLMLEPQVSTAGLDDAALARVLAAVAAKAGVGA